MQWTIRDHLRCSSLLNSPNQAITEQTLYVEKASFDNNIISIFVRGQTHRYEVRYLPANLKSKTLLSAYNESLQILSEDSFDGIERATELLTPFELIHRSGHEDDCRPTPGIPLLFDYFNQEEILIQATEIGRAHV